MAPAGPTGPRGGDAGSQAAICGRKDDHREHHQRQGQDDGFTERGWICRPLERLEHPGRHGAEARRHPQHDGDGEALHRCREQHRSGRHERAAQERERHGSNRVEPRGPGRPSGPLDVRLGAGRQAGHDDQICERRGVDRLHHDDPDRPEESRHRQLEQIIGQATRTIGLPPAEPQHATPEPRAAAGRRTGASTSPARSIAR